jgi:hypothetical protein
MARPPKLNIDYFVINRGEMQELTYRKLILSPIGYDGLGRFIHFCDLIAQEPNCAVNLDHEETALTIADTLRFQQLDKFREFVNLLDEKGLLLYLTTGEVTTEIVNRSFESQMRSRAHAPKRQLSGQKTTVSSKETVVPTADNDNYSGKNVSCQETTVTSTKNPVLGTDNPGFDDSVLKVKKSKVKKTQHKENELFQACVSSLQTFKEPPDNPPQFVETLITKHGTNPTQVQEAIKRAAYLERLGKITSPVRLLLGPTAFRGGACVVEVDAGFGTAVKKSEKKRASDAVTLKRIISDAEYLSLNSSQQQAYVPIYDLKALANTDDWDQATTGRFCQKETIEDENPGQTALVDEKQRNLVASLKSNLFTESEEE